MNITAPAPRPPRIAVDIGSTVVKIASLDAHGDVESQLLVERDFDAGIARQVEALLAEAGVSAEGEGVLVCSSANGGLRVGIVCLAKHYSGAAMRNQVLLAGANPVFVHDFDEAAGSLERVDVLLVGGGIDCADAAPLERRLRAFEPSRYRFGALVYAGNRHLAAAFSQRFPDAVVVANPLADSLTGRSLSIFEAIRRAYLDDLIYKEGVSELRSHLVAGILPTPEIVSRGLQRALAGMSSIRTSGACVAFDIGGATTDLHYTVEIVREDSDQRPTPGVSVARFVFTDLGIVASRDSLMLQLRNHPRLYELLDAVLPGGVREAYQAMRESDYQPTPLVLSYGCLFIALDRFSRGQGPGLPAADLTRIAQIILTGGAAQSMADETVLRLFDLFRAKTGARPEILIDSRYQLWVDGITWSDRAPV